MNICYMYTRINRQRRHLQVIKSEDSQTGTDSDMKKYNREYRRGQYWGNMGRAKDNINSNMQAGGFGGTFEITKGEQCCLLD